MGGIIDDIIDEEDISLPDKLAEIFRGKLLFGLDLLLDYEEDRQDWEGDAYPNFRKEYDRVWHNKMSFFQVGNGDYIAIELEPENYGKVVYLSHDGSENHGLYIADNFKEFLMNYAAVGCTGGEDWQWVTFLYQRQRHRPYLKERQNLVQGIGDKPQGVGRVKSKKMNNKR